MKLFSRIYALLILSVLSGCVTSHLQYQDLPIINGVEKIDELNEILEHLDLHKKFEEIAKNNPPPLREGGISLEDIVVTASRRSAPQQEESITNNQEQGVDQGDIVKRLGDYAFILRKGVLYSVFLGNEQNSQMQLIKKLSVQANGGNYHSWYDELLVYDDFLLVLGYSYRLGVSELVFFRRTVDGSFAFHQRYLIETDDYFDVENSAIRIVDGKLLMVLPRRFALDELREEIVSGEINTLTVDFFNANARQPESIELVAKQDWIKTAQKLSDNIYVSQVYSCPLDRLKNDHLRCDAVNLVGAYGKFYVSTNAVYLWNTDSPQSFDYQQINPRRYGILSRRGLLDKWQDENNANVIYRIPHDESDVTAVVVQGRPLNQFSFQERGERFSVISTVYSHDEDRSIYDVYGLEFSLLDFSTASPEIDPNEYVLIASQERRPKANRFLGEQVFVSTVEYGDEKLKTNVSVWDMVSDKVVTFDTPFYINAFHPLGENMLAMGLDLDGSLVLESWLPKPVPQSVFIQKFPNFFPTESRSVGFNSKEYDEKTVFGIPVVEYDNEQYEEYIERLYWQKKEPPMDILFFDLEPTGQFTVFDRLLSSREPLKEDTCIVSCEDWYGVARPFFINEHIYGLINFELLKSNYDGTRMSNLQRLNIQTGELRFQ